MCTLPVCLNTDGRECPFLKRAADLGRAMSVLLLFFTSVMSKIQRVAADRLIHPIKALCIFNGDMQLVPQLLKRFIRRQVQTIEAFGKKRDKRGITFNTAYISCYVDILPLGGVNNHHINIVKLEQEALMKKPNYISNNDNILKKDSNVLLSSTVGF